MILCVAVIVTLAGIGMGAFAQTSQPATSPPARGRSLRSRHRRLSNP